MQEQLPSGDPDKSAQRVERPEGGPQYERSESSRCLFSICYWIPACAGMTEYESTTTRRAGGMMKAPGGGYG